MSSVVLLLLQYTMLRYEQGKDRILITTNGTICGHLRHRHSLTVNHDTVAIEKPSLSADFNLTIRNCWFSSFIVSSILISTNQDRITNSIYERLRIIDGLELILGEHRL